MTASRPARRGRWRRIVLRVVVALMLLLVAAFVFRNRVLAPLVRPAIVAAITDALHADRVSIGAFDGDWIRTLTLHDVDVESSRSPVRALRSVRVTVTWDLLALLRGDLEGLRSVNVHADAVDLDLATPTASPPAAPAKPPLDAAFEGLLRLAADGATVDVGDFRLRTVDGERRGPLALTLGAGTTSRRLELAWTDLHVTADVDRFDAEQIAGRAVAVTVPGATVAVPAVTLPNPWTRPGRLAAGSAGNFTVDVTDLTPWAGLLPAVLRERLPLRALVRGSVRDGMLRVAAGDVHVRGLALAISEGELAIARDDWRAASASIRCTAKLDDFAVVIPALGACTFAGEIDGRIDGPLATPSASIGLQLGRCTSDLGAFAAANGTLRLDARGLGDPVLRVEGLTTHRTIGAPIAVALHGEGTLPLHTPTTSTATEAAFTLRLSAERPAAADGTPALSLTATLRADDRSLRCDDVAFAAGPATLRGGATLERGMGALLAGDVVEAPLRADFALAEMELAGVPTAWLGSTKVGGRVTGTIALSGTVRQPRPDVQLAWHDAHLRVPDVGGIHDGSLQIAFATPGVDAIELRVEGNCVVDLPGRDTPLRLAATLRCANDGTRLSPAVIELDAAKVTADLASDLALDRLLAGVDPRTATVTGSLRAADLPLASLPEELHGLGPLEGFVDVDANVRGTLGAIGLLSIERGRVTIRDGNIRFGDGARLERLALALHVDPQVVELVSLDGVMGAGHVTATGSLRTDGGTLLEHFDAATVDLRVHADDALLFRSAGAKVRADADLTVTGTPVAMNVGGEVALGRGSKYVRRISVLPDLHSRGGAPAGLGLRLPALPPAIGSRLHFDVAVRSEAPFEARTHLFDGDLDVAARLLGTGDAPRFEGTVSLGDGRLRFPGAVLRVTGGHLTFTRADPLFPTLQLNAEGKRMGVTVTMVVRGPYDRPEVTLTSLPPLPTQDLVLLLSTGQLPSTLATRGAYGQARVVGEYLATEAWESLFGSDSTERGPTLLDRVTVETGREVSRNGIESVSVEYELVPDFGLRAERDRYEDFNLGIVLRFRLP